MSTAIRFVGVLLNGAGVGIAIGGDAHALRLALIIGLSGTVLQIIGMADD